MFRYPGFHSFCQLAQRHFEDICNLPQAAHGGVQDSALDPTDVGPVEAALAAEPLLRLARSLTEFAYYGSYGSRPQVGRLYLPWPVASADPMIGHSLSPNGRMLHDEKPTFGWDVLFAPGSSNVSRERLASPEDHRAW